MGRPSVLPPRAAAPGQERVPVALRLHGACSTALDPDIFFESSRRRPHAQAVCARCPVAGICLEYAMGSESDGVWGGTTPQRQTQRGNVLLLSVEARRAGDELDASLQMRTQQDVADARGISVRTVERWFADRRQSRAA